MTSKFQPNLNVSISNITSPKTLLRAGISSRRRYLHLKILQTSWRESSTSLIWRTLARKSTFYLNNLSSHRSTLKCKGYSFERASSNLLYILETSFAKVRVTTVYKLDNVMILIWNDEFLRDGVKPLWGYISETVHFGNVMHLRCTMKWLYSIPSKRRNHLL